MSTVSQGFKRSRRWAPFVLLGTVVLPIGCNDESRLGGGDARPLDAGSVTVYDVTLDEKAGARQVVYALLRAIKDDVEAKNPEAREAAFQRQLTLCAPDHIYARALHKSLGRDEAIRRIVWHWAPALAHYKDDFPADWESGSGRLRMTAIAVAGDTEGKYAKRTVFIKLADPGGNPNAAAVAAFDLEVENGLWRVVQVGFTKKRRIG